MSSLGSSDLLNYVLLIVEPFLLIVTVLLLALNRREVKGRDRLLERLSAATDVVTRQEYFVTILETLQSAKNYIFGSVTGSAPAAEESEVLHQVTSAVSQAVARGVRVKYLLPDSPDRLQMAQRYVQAGAEVRFNPGVLISDARYMVVDDKSVVIGVPERKGKNEPTRKGYTVPSESVASMFREQFERLWNSNETKSYEQYVREVVGRARQSNPTFSPELIAANLKIDKEVVERALKPAP